MIDEAGTAPTWGYRPNGEARIFDLAPGEDLPEGWHASPTVITDAALATAEALSAAAARAAAADRETVPPAKKRLEADLDVERAALVEENERLRAENARLSADLAVLREQISQVGADLAGAPQRIQAAGGTEASAEAVPIVTKGRFPTIERPAAVTGDNPASAEASPGSGENAPADQVSCSPNPGTAPALVQPGQPRSREEARAAVRALLGEELTDREVARRAGVSPSTVAAVRRAACAAEE